MEEQEAGRSGELTKAIREHACIRERPDFRTVHLQALDRLVGRILHRNFPTGCLTQVSVSLPQSTGSRLARLVGPKLHTAHEGSQHLTVLQVTRVASGQHVALGFFIEQPQDVLVMDLQSRGIKTVAQRSCKHDCRGVWALGEWALGMQELSGTA